MYYKYLQYVIKHKYYVMIECFKVGLYWRGLVHDMSKFRPSEFIPYARYFYGDYRELKEISTYEKTYYNFKCKETIKRDFDKAWLHHIHRNKHHWQYWILREDSGKKKILHIPYKYLLEMICDWNGAGMAINGKKDTVKWYEKNKDNMLLNQLTRTRVEYILDKLK